MSAPFVESTIEFELKPRGPDRQRGHWLIRIWRSEPSPLFVMPTNDDLHAFVVTRWSDGWDVEAIVRELGRHERVATVQVRELGKEVSRGFCVYFTWP